MSVHYLHRPVVKPPVDYEQRPIDLYEALSRRDDLRQLRLSVHPRINWLQVAIGVIVVYVLLVAAMVLL